MTAHTPSPHRIQRRMPTVTSPLPPRPPSSIPPPGSTSSAAATRCTQPVTLSTGEVTLSTGERGYTKWRHLLGRQIEVLQLTAWLLGRSDSCPPFKTAASLCARRDSMHAASMQGHVGGYAVSVSRSEVLCPVCRCRRGVGDLEEGEFCEASYYKGTGVLL